MKKQKWLIVICILAMALGMVGCAKGGSGSKTDYTMWLYSSVDSSYYSDYSENPALQYALANWTDEDIQIGLEFWVPPAGSALDNLNNMMASGDLPDVIDISAGTGGSGGLPAMVKDGVIVDLTDYVKECMPNYLAFLEANPNVKKDVISLDEEGNERFYHLANVSDAAEDPYCGYEYRRDWIVKYGTNPVTGEPFTGGYTGDPAVDPYCWEDNVVFPSGHTDPYYISDWEWMFEIFEKAYEDLGLTDSYCISIQYQGNSPFGQIIAAFGGGCNGQWYRTPDNKAVFGATSDDYRAFLECMNAWYEKGWLDPYFYERSSDMFYAIDDAKVRTGQIGMWYGLVGTLGNRLDAGDALTSGICVYTAFTPINDIYGAESTKYQEPYTYYAGSQSGGGYVITQKALDDGKDIRTLLRFFDYFYSEEGAALKSFGLSAEQQAEMKSEFYTKKGLDNGAYTVTEDGKYCLVDTIRLDGGNLDAAVKVGKVPGLTLVKDEVSGYGTLFDHMMDTWTRNENIGNFAGKGTVQVSEEVEQKLAKIVTNAGSYVAQNFSQFITGRKDIHDDAQWSAWCKTLEKYGVSQATELYQEIFDEYPLQ